MPEMHLTEISDHPYQYGALSLRLETFAFPDLWWDFCLFSGSFVRFTSPNLHFYKTKVIGDQVVRTYFSEILQSELLNLK